MNDGFAFGFVRLLLVTLDVRAVFLQGLLGDLKALAGVEDGDQQSNEELRQKASAFHARLSGQILPDGGYMPHPTEADRIIPYEEWMAIQNADPSRTDLGRLFVDAYPFVPDQDIRVEFHPTGRADEGAD